MKHIFIINTFTVKKVDKLIEKIEYSCNKLKLDYIIELNSINLTTEDILKKYKNTKYIILAVGGDGILNRVMNAIIDTNNILGLIPYGTGNDFYKSAKIQFEGLYNDCDLTKINNKFFINTACFGIDAEVANNTHNNKMKFLSKKYKYKTSLIKTFITYKSKTLKITIDNDSINDKFTTIVISNGMYYGSGFNIGPSSILNDNYIDVYLVKKLNKISMLNLILKMKKGKHENDSRITKYKTKKLIISSKEKIKCNIDGEELESNRFNIELNKKIKIYFNKELINSIKE